VPRADCDTCPNVLCACEQFIAMVTVFSSPFVSNASFVCCQN